ncbi:MAG: acyl-ACP thioesterase domain-containing protein [Acidimicrobiales bacterium]
MATPDPRVDFIPFPGRGRQFLTSDVVRFGDTHPSGRLRLDALARLVQDTGNDDLADAGLDPASPWVTRRTSVWVPGRWPSLGEPLTVATFCSGLGTRWGDRRTSVRSPSGVVEVAAVWIFLDDVGRPARLPESFLAVYGESAEGRRTSTRLHHPGPPAAADRRSWPLRATDIDVFGHVNNTAMWMPIEDELSRRGLVPRFAEIEYRLAIGAGDQVELVSHVDGERLGVWLTAGGDVRASALLVT